MEIITKGNIRILSVSEGFAHKIGTNDYAKSITMLPGDTIEMYEEAERIPAFTKAEFDAKVEELVRRRYSESEEFAIQRKAINAAIMQDVAMFSDDAVSYALDEFAEYNAYVEECKARAEDPQLYVAES